MLLERRWELPGRGIPVYDFPTDQRFCGRSLFWYCYQCGKRYAEVRAWVDEKPAVWHGVFGCCPDCPGNLWTIPGSLEYLSHSNWASVPETVIRYQLECELNFLSNPGHPHNKELLSHGT